MWLLHLVVLGLYPNLDIKAGVIDHNYRGQLKIIFHNSGINEITLPKRTRVAQLILEKIENTPVEVVQELAPSQRNDKGFGSTGTSTTPQLETPAETIEDVCQDNTQAYLLKPAQTPHTVKQVTPCSPIESIL